MPRRTQVNKTENIEKASDFEDLVVDKRFGKRAKARKNRRNRHYIKTMLRNIKEDIDDTSSS
jgi:hypothetical protein